MSTDQQSSERVEQREGLPVDAFETDVAWKGGAVAGVVAAAVMGVAITAANAGTVRIAIAGLYGQSGNVLVGWVAHLVHGALFGVVFAMVMADPGLYGVTRWRWKSTLAGLVFGLVMAIAGAGIIMPMWLEVVGFESPPTIPNVTTPLLVWHAIYGVVLGAVFPSVESL